MFSEPIHIYAVSVGGIFAFLLLVNTLPYFQASLAFAHRLILQYLVFPQLLRRNRFVGPWSPADVLLQICYVTANAFCLGFRAESFGEAGVRAARLSLINMVPAFAGPHLSFLADVLGVSLRTFRRIHRSAGVVSVLLLALHVATVVAAKTQFPLQDAKNMWALVVHTRFRPSGFLSYVLSLADDSCLGCVVAVLAASSVTPASATAVLRVVSADASSAGHPLRVLNLAPSMAWNPLRASDDVYRIGFVPVFTSCPVAPHSLPEQSDGRRALPGVRCV
jgi:hypothetical protein